MLGPQRGCADSGDLYEKGYLSVTPFERLSAAGQARRLRTLLHEVCAQYDFQPARISLLSHGENTTFRLDESDRLKSNRIVDSGTVPGRYTIRLHRPGYQTPASIQSERVWLSALCEAQMNVPRPLTTRQGDLVLAPTGEGIPNPWLAVAFGWLAGRRLCAAAPRISALSPRWTVPLLRRLGTAVGRMHQGAEAFVAPRDFVRYRWDWHGFFGHSPRCGCDNHSCVTKWPLDDADSWMDVLGSAGGRPLFSLQERRLIDDAATRLHAVMNQLGEDRSVFGLIHGDLHLNNFLFEQQRIIITDFDDCGWGYYLYDIATVLFWMWGRSDFDVQKAAFLSGYQSIRRLSHEEQEALEAFMVLRGLYLARWAITRREHPGIGRLMAWLPTEAMQRIQSLSSSWPRSG